MLGIDSQLFGSILHIAYWDSGVDWTVFEFATTASGELRGDHMQ